MQKLSQGQRMSCIIKTKYKCATWAVSRIFFVIKANQQFNKKYGKTSMKPCHVSIHGLNTLVSLYT